MEQVKILVVEDNEDINRILRHYLEKEGYQTVAAFSGTEAKLQMTINSFQLVLLDLMLPGMSGEELIAEINEKYHMPIIVISAKSTIEDKVNVLKLGADDYITKPFERDEVLARVGAVLRRSNGGTNSLITDKQFSWKNLVLKTNARRVFVREKEIDLTVHEFEILLLLMQYPDRVFTKDILYQEVWKSGYYGEDNTINVHISNLRKKIKEKDDESYIKTVWGVGFKMEDKTVTCD
ncbi:MAG TPA: response regulator transcription factor [Mobilitalea sp.]|nr:response regulator transcription factor [Mobilitalea sp.]